MACRDDASWLAGNVHTLMCDLKDGPEHFLPLFALCRSILGVFELVLEFEKGVFNVIESIGWSLALTSRSDGWHLDVIVDDLSSPGEEVHVEQVERVKASSSLRIVAKTSHVD